MPNHIKTVIFFDGDPELIKKMREEIGGYDPENREGDYVIDFDKLIPMPKELDIVSGSASSSSHTAYCVLNDLDLPGYSTIIKKHWEEEVERRNAKRKVHKLTLKAWLLEQAKKGENEIDLALGKQVYDNIKNYGCESWYDWRVAHWGTKWNCYECEEEGDRRIAFLTAWSPPVPIFDELAKRYPKITFQTYSVDEGDDSTVWNYVYTNGKQWNFSCIDNPELVEKIWDATGTPYVYPFKEKKENAEDN